MHTPTPTHPHTAVPDAAIEGVEALVDAAALLAAAMTLALAPETRDQINQLRANGWRLCLEVAMNAEGGAGVTLTSVAPDGRTRQAISDLATDAPSDMH